MTIQFMFMFDSSNFGLDLTEKSKMRGIFNLHSSGPTFTSYFKWTLMSLTHLSS